MATKNIVPNANSEGGIGTSSKYWATGFIDAITTTGNLVVGGNATFSGSVTALQGSLTHATTPLILNNSGGTYTQVDFKNNGTQKGAIWWNNSDDTLNLYTGVTALTISSGGNVGIGGTLANKKLYVLGDTTNYQILAEQPSGYAGLSIKSTTIDQTWSWIASDNGANSDLLLYGGAAAGTKLTISSGGDVNIGSADGLPLMHGSVAANASYCTYSFVNDQNTGMIRTGADTLALVTAGSPKLTISSVGDATITATSTSGLKLAQTGQSYYHNIKNQGDSLYIGADDGGQGGTGADMRFAIKGSEAMRLNNGYSVSAPNLQWTTLFDIGLKLSAGSTAIVTVYASSGSGLGMATLLVMRDGYGSQTFTELGTQPTATYLSFRLNPSNLAQLQVNPSISSGNHTIKGKLLIIKS
jgi:hypothetical protein